MARRPVHYLAPLLGLAPLALLLTVGTATAQDASVAEPDSFTSAFRVALTAEQVVDAGGEPGATGTMDLRLNSEQEVICFDIVLRGVTPPFMSPARTATHIHEGRPGAAGPARIVFPDPQSGSGDTRTSSGCLSVPTVVGLMPEGSTQDAGAGFSLAEIEATPSDYYGDNHTSAFAAGAVRGQFGAALPVGGLDTGGGGPTGPSTALTTAVVVAAGAALAGTALAVRRRT